MGSVSTGGRPGLVLIGTCKESCSHKLRRYFTSPSCSYLGPSLNGVQGPLSDIGMYMTDFCLCCGMLHPL